MMLSSKFNPVHPDSILTGANVLRNWEVFGKTGGFLDGGSTIGWIQSISDRQKPELEVKLDCGKPFRAKPFAKHVTFDKFSAD